MELIWPEVIPEERRPIGNPNEKMLIGKRRI